MARPGNGAAGNRRSAAIPNLAEMPADALASEIAALAGMGVDGLRACWVQRFRCPAPPIQSADTLRRLFSFRLQALVFGGLDAETLAALKRARDAIEKGKSPVPKSAVVDPGAVLVREWRGVTHRVAVRDGGFEHEGKTYSSLSEVARTITGTRWSGPRFFGLEQKPAAKKPAGAPPRKHAS